MTARRPILTPEEVWRKYDDVEQRLTAPLSHRMLELAGLRPGMRVLDIGTGRGEPAIGAAHGVGPEGTVVGVDCAESMLQMARARADREGLSNLDLRVASAEALEGIPRNHFHVVLARWALMYFDAPIAALSAARSAMIPGGVFVGAFWAEPDRVPYYTFPREVLRRFVSLPPIDLDVPGTFRYADLNRLQQDFASAGFTIDHLEEREVAVMEAVTGAQVVDWARAFGLSRILNNLCNEIHQKWESELVKEAETLRKDGQIQLGGVTRIVVASFDDVLEGCDPGL